LLPNRYLTLFTDSGGKDTSAATLAGLVNRVDLAVDLTADEESSDGDDVGGLPRTHDLV
jgi:hypothetical protein